MASQDHLHQETQVLPVKAHCQMLTKQYAHRTLLQGHPCNRLVQRPPPPRLMKPTITDLHRQTLASLRPNATEDEVSLLNHITHTHAVQDTINSFQPNRVLGHAPPTSNVRQLELQANLSRRTRTLLSQLRSGFSSLLQSYRARISPDQDSSSSCPNCGSGPHDTQHLFNCSSRPTTSQPSDLWTRPAEVALFLQLHPDDDPGMPWDTG